MQPNNRLVAYPAPRARKVRGTHITEGQTLYAIQDRATHLFFIWSYSNKAFATRMLSRVTPESAIDIAANWRRATAELTPSSRSTFR